VANLASKISYYLDKSRFKIKRYLHEIYISEKSDHMIALSYAIGTEIAIFPTPGFSTAIGIGLLAIFKKLNKVAVFLSMLVWNAFTVLPVYWASFKVGTYISSSIPPVETAYSWLNTTILYFKQFVIGNLAVTIPISILSYFVARVVLRWSRERRSTNKLHRLR